MFFFALCYLQFHEQLPAMIQGVMSDNVDDQLGATTQFRKLLSKERNPPIDEVIRCGVVPKFVEFLRSPHPSVQVLRRLTLLMRNDGNV